MILALVNYNSAYFITFHECPNENYSGSQFIFSEMTHYLPQKQIDLEYNVCVI